MSFFSKWFKKDNKENAVDPNVIGSHALLDADVKGMPSDATINIIGEKSCIVTLMILLSYIRHYLNTGGQGEITLKIGYNKPPSVPFEFTVNDQLLDDIYPGDSLEIN